MARIFKSVYRCQEHSDFKQRGPSLALFRPAGQLTMSVRQGKADLAVAAVDF